jgi:hypothetical protein
MAASKPLPLSTLATFLGVEAVLGGQASIEVYGPNTDYLGTVGEATIQDGVARLYTIKYDEHPVSQPGYDEWDLYGDDQIGVMLFHVPCSWSEMFVDGGLTRILELVRAHDCSIMNTDNKE